MNANQKTDQLIRKLSDDLLNPSESKNWFSQFWFSFVSCFSLIAILTYVAAATLPAYIHLPSDLQSASFWGECILWMGLSLSAAFVTYQSSRPMPLPLKSTRIAYGISILIGVALLARLPLGNVENDLQTELNLSRGPCGGFIFMTGTFSALWMFFILKRATPVRLAFTGAWAALSVGSLASFFMHLVCTHENSVHAFIWHVAPLIGLTAVGAGVGKKLIRW